jgi:ferredoxin
MMFQPFNRMRFSGGGGVNRLFTNYNNNSSNSLKIEYIVVQSLLKNITTTTTSNLIIIRNKTTFPSITLNNNNNTNKLFLSTATSNNTSTIKITIVQKDNSLKTIQGVVGTSLLKTAQENDIELEGACEGSVACSTCHVILEPQIYNSLPSPSEDEDDMLDMAYGLTPTSRLSCQVKLTNAMDGMKVILPKATRNFYVDGHKPTPH